MVKIEFGTAIAVFLFFFVALVIGRWIFYNYKRKDDVYNNSKYLKQCPYCALIFFNYRKKDQALCPRCKSYIT